MSSNSGRINKKDNGKRKSNQKIVYRGGDAETNKSFIDKLRLEVDKYRISVKKSLGNGADVELVGRGNCNYDLIFTAGLIPIAKNTYDVYLTQFMGRTSDVRKKLLTDNPFNNLIANGGANMSTDSAIFNLVYKLNYLYIFYLCIYRNNGEEFLTTFLNSDNWTTKPVNTDKLIDTIKSYDSNINQLKQLGIIEEMPDDEQDAFKIVMVVYQIFSQTMRELGNISVRVNGTDDLDRTTRGKHALYSQEDYISFGNCIINILTIFSESLYKNSTIALFVLFSSLPTSGDLIGNILIAALPFSDVYLNDASQQNDQPGMFQVLNNFPAGLTKDEDKNFINELLVPQNSDSLLTQQINSLFAPLSGQAASQQDFTLTEYMKKGNYIDIVITNADFYAKTTDVWLLIYSSTVTAEQLICGFVLVTMIYDFKNNTYTNENQIRWYIDERDNERLSKFPSEYYSIPACINPAATQRDQGEPNIGIALGNKMPYILGALGTAGAVAVGLYFGKVFGGKTRKKSRKPRRTRGRNATTRRKRRTSLRRVKNKR
jgi:hypothetical protein